MSEEARLREAIVDLWPLPEGAFFRSTAWEQGKRLLASGMAVSEVALAVGFFDQSHFHHGFRQAFGLTPAEFRAQMQSFTSRTPR